MPPTTASAFNFIHTVELLQQILEARLSNVVGYTYYACCVAGRLRLPLSRLFQAQANHSLVQAQAVSNILLALNERPGESSCGLSTRSHPTQMHAPEQFLASALNHELQILALCQEVLELTQGHSRHLHQFAQEQWLATQGTYQDLHQELQQLKQSQQTLSALSRPLAAHSFAPLPSLRLPIAYAAP